MDASFFSHNRRTIGTRAGLVILAANTRMQQRNDTFYPFKQEANFWYLAGIEQPDWLVIIDGATGEEWLVQPEIDEVHAVFDGALTPERARTLSGIKKILPHDEGMALLRKLARKHSVVQTIFNPPHASHFNFTLNPAVSINKRMLERIFTSVKDCQKELALLRAIKQPEEIQAIQRSIDLTTKAFEQVKNLLASAKYEYEIEAAFSHHFKRSGGHGHAYEPIIAAGGNACILHYVENSRRVRARQLVLMDVGACVDGYAADITRTYAKGEPTKRQRQVHDAVRSAHNDIVGIIRPGLLIEDYLKQVDTRMQQALMEVGLLKYETDTDMYRKYFPHAISHGLGIDVHDSLGGAKYFEPNMVLTVEPGIYIPEESIGVRIEDDIRVTDTGSRNLSAKLSTEL